MQNIISAPRHGFILQGVIDEQKATVLDYLKTINGRSKTNVITYFSELEKIVEMAENRLDHALVGKGARIGCTAFWRDGGPSAKSYKYAMAVNEISLRRYAEGWRLMSARKVEVRHGVNTAFNVSIPVRYIEQMKRKAVAGFSAIREKEAA
jgi:hypothetical protein